MKQGPPTIGETVDTIHQHARWRGILLGRDGELASIGIVGRFEALIVPFETCQPIREASLERFIQPIPASGPAPVRD